MRNYNYLRNIQNIIERKFKQNGSYKEAKSDFEVEKTPFGVNVRAFCFSFSIRNEKTTIGPFIFNQRFYLDNLKNNTQKIVNTDFDEKHVDVIIRVVKDVKKAEVPNEVL